MARVFSGIQPTGDSVHLGNYLGAIVGMLELQREHTCIFAVVDLHAITVPQPPDVLRKMTREVAGSLIAAGIDPGRARRGGGGGTDIASRIGDPRARFRSRAPRSTV